MSMKKDFAKLAEEGNKAIQDRKPNFRKDGKLYLISCFVCDENYGRENYTPFVATGKCAWCGWKEGENETA